MGFLANKKILICGLASKRSIAFGIAAAMQREGAELGFTYQGEKIRERVAAMAAEWNSQIVLPCDVARDDEITAVFQELAQHWDGIDAIVHSIAYAPADQLEGDYLECLSRDGFRIAHDISSYSFAALAKAAQAMMAGRNGSLLTMTYLGAERAVPNYNVMGIAKASLEANIRYLANSLGAKGIRVNGISAGPIKTLAAAGIKNFRKMLAYNKKVTPLQRNISLENVGNTAAFLCSDMAAGITGEIIHVDAGFHCVAMNDLPHASEQ